MTPLDALSDPITGPAAGALGTAVVTTLGLVAAKLINRSKHAAANAAMVKRVDREADALEAKAAAEVKVAEIEAAPALIEKVNELWEKRNECEEARRADRLARDKERVEDAEKCKHETARQVEAENAPLRAEVARLATLAASARADDTGMHQLLALADRVVRKSPTPAKPMEAQPDRRGELAVRREIPPPKRGKETR